MERERKEGTKNTIVFRGRPPEIPDIVLKKEDLGGVKVWTGSIEKGFRYFQSRTGPKRRKPKPGSD
jgi:hypothetical protein